MEDAWGQGRIYYVVKTYGKEPVKRESLKAQIRGNN